jgi:hypothetical protein
MEAAGKNKARAEREGRVNVAQHTVLAGEHDGARDRVDDGADGVNGVVHGGKFVGHEVN